MGRIRNNAIWNFIFTHRSSPSKPCFPFSPPQLSSFQFQWNPSNVSQNMLDPLSPSMSSSSVPPSSCTSSQLTSVLGDNSARWSLQLGNASDPSSASLTDTPPLGSIHRNWNMRPEEKVGNNKIEMIAWFNKKLIWLGTSLFFYGRKKRRRGECRSNITGPPTSLAFHPLGVEMKWRLDS